MRISAAEVTGDWPVSVDRELKAQARRAQIDQRFVKRVEKVRRRKR
jgi:hypothetical protein